MSIIKNNIKKKFFSAKFKVQVRLLIYEIIWRQSSFGKEISLKIRIMNDAKFKLLSVSMKAFFKTRCHLGDNATFHEIRNIHYNWLYGLRARKLKEFSCYFKFITFQSFHVFVSFRFSFFNSLISFIIIKTIKN